MGWGRIVSRGRDTKTAAGIEKRLSLAPFGRPVEFGAALVGALPAMVLPAAEGTSKIPTIRVAGMGEKPDPAVSAVRDTALKLGTQSQDRVQLRLILPDKRLGAIILVPIRPKREKLLDGDDKKARFSVTMRKLFCTPSSYRIDAKASRGRARFFMRYLKKRVYGDQHKRTATHHRLDPHRFSLLPGLATRHLFNQLLENPYLEERTLFFFPSSGSI